MENEQYIESGLSVGTTKIANKYEIFTEEEVDIINNKIPELDERVSIIEYEIEDINSSLGDKANKNDVAKISSGTPMFADDTSKMLDTSKNYVNLSDGYVYVYNGAKFEKTDVMYQSRGIPENSITPSMLKNGIELINLYKYPENCIEGKYINMDGNILNGDGAYVKVPVKPSTVYSFWRRFGNYQTGKGWVLLCNSEDSIIQRIDGSMNINGAYDGVEYVTIKTTSESAYLCFNARLSDFDNRNDIIVVEGEKIELALGINKIFNYNLIDTLFRSKFSKFLESFKSTGNNLYNYESDYISNKYVSLDGYLLHGDNWGTAKLTVERETTYSIYMPNGNYSNDIGALAFYNGSEIVSIILPSSTLINGQYNGIDYITFTTPNPCTHVYITCKRASANNSFDNSKSLICIKGNSINDESLMNYLTEVNGYKIKDHDELFSKFLESFKSTGNNLYNYESDYISNKYVSLDGYLLHGDNWGTAKLTVERETTYSIYMPNGNYSNDIGALAFYNGSEKVSFKSPAADFINGQYNGIDYITFTTPSPCTHVYITCKRGAANKPFDNSETLICVKGNVINDDSLMNYLTEVNGYKIKGYDDYINESITHPLKGKKWVVVGDSLTEVNSRTTKNYHKYIADETGVEVINMGVSGTGYKRNDEYGSAFYQRINNIPTDADIVTIFGSGNDLGLFSENNLSVLGEVTDTTTDTICGCINVTLDNLYKRIPTVRLGIVTPTPWVGYPPHVENNKMELYSQKLIEICKRRSIPVLDLYHGSNLRPWDETFRKLMYSRDDGNGVHPDENGHKQIHRFFLKFIETL